MTRVCGELGCPTILSRYNEGPRCWVHQARVEAAERALIRPASAAGRRRREVEAMILDAPAPLTAHQIADAFGMTPQGVGIHLRDLLAAGVIERRRVGLRPRGSHMVYAPARPVSDRLAA